MRQSLSNGLFNPRGNRAAYTVPNLIVVILTNFQDARGTNKVTGKSWLFACSLRGGERLDELLLYRRQAD